MFDRFELRFRHVLRAAVVVVGVLALAAIAVGRMPGYEVYRDDVLVDHAPAAGDVPAFTLFMAWIAATGMLAWIRPHVRFALAWSGLAWAGFLAFRVCTPDKVPRGWVSMWEFDVLVSLCVAALVIVLFAVPLAAGAHFTGWLDEDESPEEPPAASGIPAARVHRERNRTAGGGLSVEDPE